MNAMTNKNQKQTAMKYNIYNQRKVGIMYKIIDAF